MTSLPGGFRSDFRRPPPSQSVSSLSPLAAPFKAGGLPPMNPPQVGSTAPTFPSGTHQYPNPHPKFETDSFRFSSGEDMPLYASYGAWKDSWAPIVSGGEESVSWMDPSLSYPLSPADKGTRSSINFPSYEESPIKPTISNPLSNPYRFVPETSDPFSKGFRSSVVSPMLRELSDSFSLTSSPYEKSSNYDKYMYQLESCSSPTGSNLNGSNPYQSSDPFDPCTRSFNYFDYMQKEPVHVPVRDSASLCRTRVTITAPASVGTDSGTKNLKVGFGGAGTSLEGFLNCTSGTDKIDDDLDSPCWKGDQRSMTSQLPFSEGQNGNLSNANPNMVNENPNFNSAQDKKLMSFCADSTSNEEIPKEDKLGSDFELEASSLNKLERRVSCEKNEKSEACEKVCEKNDLPKTDVKLLIKSMHDLSQVLLSSCGDGFNLEECEFELLRGSIENLKTFTARNTKVNAGANNNNVFESIKSTRDIEQAFNERNNQVNLASKLGDNDHKKSILQALEKLPKQGCDVQAELYKNLWLEAEVSLCTLKYELQLAKSKLKIENPNQDNQQVDSSSSSDKLKSSEPIKIDQSSIKEAPISEPLKKPEPNEKQQSPKIKENKTTENVKIPVVPQGHIGNFNLSQAMDNTVMARLRILKSREQNNNYNEDNNNNNNNNNINNNNNSNLVYPDFYTLGYNAADVRENYTNFSSEWEHVVKESCEN